MTDTEVALKQPGAELLWHITQKGWQMGAVLGVGIAAPIAVFRNRGAGLTLRAQLPRIMRAVRNTSVVTTGIIPAVGAARMSQLDADGIHDRAYRLRYNEGQNRTDRFSAVGEAAGAAAGAALRGLSATSIISGAAVGTAAAVLAHVTTSGRDAVPNQMVEEAKSLTGS